MCVIAIVENGAHRPNERQIRQMWASNPFGAGAAWRNEDKLSFKKGLDLEQIIALVPQLPAPFVIHFRVPSVGGSKPILTHPFVLDKDATPMMEGELPDKWVLFHNGTWREWASYSKEWLAKAGGAIKQPLGPWSDSRAMAFWAFHFGHGIFEEPWPIDEKVVLMGPDPDDLEMFPQDGKGWSIVDGFIVSNTYWQKEVLPEEKISKDNSMFSADAEKSGNHKAQPEKHIRVETGNDRGKAAGSTGNPRVRAAIKGKDPSVHPFQAARENYETAIYAWTLGEGSKKSMKRAKKTFERLGAKHPGLLKEALAHPEFQKTLEILEIQKTLVAHGNNAEGNSNALPS